MKRLMIGGLAALAIGLTGAPAAEASAGDAVLLVPSDVTPGVYMVTIEPGRDYAYFAVCGDYACDAKCRCGSIIHNGNLDPDRSRAIVMVVPPNAVSVEVTNAILTKMADG